jgi:hypothetical protein
MSLVLGQRAEYERGFILPIARDAVEGDYSH